ncbi:helix-turn-helix domain-containing protein [Adlercreutzia sp. ZJ141]|uniref:helix-turn-helix domain-containing protein n=1 Tax=Adlercreutzia sp. ZJ141 TaxID=2709406 RepID=UPI0013EC80A4|nr:helix-turn-helix transcriptional regulator [Adlercreutzia sp. ZJ141]
MMGYLSLGLLYGWLDVVSGSFSLVDATSPLTAVNHSALLFMLTLVTVSSAFLAAFLHRFVDPSFLARNSYIGFAVLLSVGTVISNCVDEGMLGTEFLVVGALCGGVSVVWGFIGCARIYARLSLSEIVLYACLSKVVGTLVYFVILPLPTILATISMVVVSCAAMLLLGAVRNERAIDYRGDLNKRENTPLHTSFGVLSSPHAQWVAAGVRKSSVYKLALVCFVIFFVTELTKSAPLAYADQGNAVTSYSLIHFGTLALCATAALTIAMHQGRNSRLVSKGFYFAVATLVSFFVLLPFLAPQAPMVSWVCGSLRNLLDAVVFSLSAIVYRKLEGSSVSQIYALIGGFHSLGSFCGRLFISFMQLDQSPYMLYVLLGIDLLTILLLFVAFTPKDLESLLSPVGSNDGELSDDDSVADAIPLEFANEVGLTTRETEIFSLLIRGYTTVLISEKLHISQSTVKSHLSKVYLKAGVSTRGELIVAMEDYRNRNR